MTTFEKLDYLNENRPDDVATLLEDIRGEVDRLYARAVPPKYAVEEERID